MVRLPNDPAFYRPFTRESSAARNKSTYREHLFEPFRQAFVYLLIGYPAYVCMDLLTTNVYCRYALAIDVGGEIIRMTVGLSL